LSAEQREQLTAESSPAGAEATLESLLRQAHSAIERALVALRGADPSTLHAARAVGRAALPTTVFGVLFHIAEHTQRHTGQIIAMSKVVRESA
jgi:hypothetical protein